MQVMKHASDKRSKVKNVKSVLDPKRYAPSLSPIVFVLFFHFYSSIN